MARTKSLAPVRSSFSPCAISIVGRVCPKVSPPSALQVLLRTASLRQRIEEKGRQAGVEEGDALAPRACAEPPSSEKSLYVLSWLQVCWALSVAGRIAYRL